MKLGSQWGKLGREVKNLKFVTNFKQRGVLIKNVYPKKTQELRTCVLMKQWILQNNMFYPDVTLIPPNAIWVKVDKVQFSNMRFCLKMEVIL